MICTFGKFLRSNRRLSIEIRFSMTFLPRSAMYTQGSSSSQSATANPSCIDEIIERVRQTDSRVEVHCHNRELDGTCSILRVTSCGWEYKVSNEQVHASEDEISRFC